MNDTLELLYYRDSGGGAIWKAGDQYQIRRPLILLDQPGRGQGDVIYRHSPHQSHHWEGHVAASSFGLKLFLERHLYYYR